MLFNKPTGLFSTVTESKAPVIWKDIDLAASLLCSFDGAWLNIH